MRLPFKKLTESDRGATALLVASTMFLLMGIAAVVIDGGFGWSERRQAQAAVDFGSLAALQAAKSCGVSCSLATAVDNGAAEARTVVEANLPGRTLDWAEVDCDPNRPAEYTEVASTTNCVSFTENLDKSRVALPDDDLDTSFGRVIGFNTITVVAQAEAGAYIEASTDVIPHTPTGSGAGEACLMANQAPQSIPPCNGAISGFFGYLDVALYGSDTKGTPSTCEQGTSNTRVAINMTKGGDHNLVEYELSPPDPVIDDFDACPNTEEDVNQLVVQTGSPTGGITDGLLNGVSGSINGQSFTAEDGRIICGAYSTACQTVRGTYNLDHTPLWEFLVSGWSGQCDEADVDTREEMVNCLNWYTTSNQTAPLFTAALSEHPRFAGVPLLYSNGPNPHDPAPDGPGAYRIKEFIPVWLETLFFNCNANTCNTIHSPGLTTPPPACPNPIDPVIRNCGWSHSSGSDDVESLLALTLTLDMLDPSVQATFPGTEAVREYALTK